MLEMSDCAAFATSSCDSVPPKFKIIPNRFSVAYTIGRT